MSNNLEWPLSKYKTLRNTKKLKKKKLKVTNSSVSLILFFITDNSVYRHYHKFDGNKKH